MKCDQPKIGWAFTSKDPCGARIGLALRQGSVPNVQKWNPGVPNQIMAKRKKKKTFWTGSQTPPKKKNNLSKSSCLKSIENLSFLLLKLPVVAKKHTVPCLATLIPKLFCHFKSSNSPIFQMTLGWLKRLYVGVFCGSCPHPISILGGSLKKYKYVFFFLK